MSDYTPTTEDVRLAARDGYANRISGPAFDRWLAAHDAEVRADADSDPAKDERLVRYMAMVTPLGYQSALAVVQEMTKLLAAEDIARRDALAGRDSEEPEGEHVFIERYGMHHAKFGGIGGDAISLTISREAWKDMGEPRVLAVSWEPVEQEGEVDGH